VIFSYLPCIRRPRYGVPVGLLPSCLVWKTIEWWMYPMVEKVWRYVYPFWQNARTWQTDTQTDRHRITSKAALDESIARQKPSHFFVYTRRATQDLHHTWHGDRGGPSHFCTPPKLYLIRSVVTPLGAIENLWENPKMPPLRENAYNLGVCPLKVTKLKT